MRRHRRALGRRARESHARELARRLSASLCLRRGRRIACYLANDGEISLMPLIQDLWKRGKSVYVPALHGAKLWFLPMAHDTPLTPNRFGIPEPDLGPQARCSPRALDLVLVPLVAFDEHGTRLGMGGGFYDRTFAFLRHRTSWCRPRLIGVGYEFQRVVRLPTRPWDVVLHGAATERGLVTFPAKSTRSWSHRHRPTG